VPIQSQQKLKGLWQEGHLPRKWSETMGIMKTGTVDQISWHPAKPSVWMLLLAPLAPNRRNLSGDEIVNVNFFTTTSSTSFTQCALEATKFGEIAQNNGHYATQGH